MTRTSIPFSAQRVIDFMSTSVVTVNRDSPVADAIQVMESREICALPVLDSDNRVCGMLSTMDLIEVTNVLQCDVTVLPHVSNVVRQTILDALNEDYGDLSVFQVMAEDIQTVFESETLRDAARKMIQHACHHLPVVDQDGNLTGILSTTDILKAVAV